MGEILIQKTHAFKSPQKDLSFHTFIRPFYKLRKYPAELGREFFTIYHMVHTIKSISYVPYDIVDGLELTYVTNNW